MLLARYLHLPIPSLPPKLRNHDAISLRLPLRLPSQCQSNYFFSVDEPAAELSAAARKNGRFLQQMDNIPIPTMHNMIFLSTNLFQRGNSAKAEYSFIVIGLAKIAHKIHCSIKQTTKHRRREQQ